MAASMELRLDNLPSDPLLLIFSFLDFRDLLHCSYVNRRLNELSGHNPLWKNLCSKHWLLTDVDRQQRGVSWLSLFRLYYSDLGRYLQHYSVLKRAWEQLKDFLLQRCPRMIASLKGCKPGRPAEKYDFITKVGIEIKRNKGDQSLK
ncbi:F-box only protein 3 [Centroberyx affinis]|uniref:F-box only protein 3 n=1 Tax=Centroberyx affinis TaxID=166261 RepID=UPI003A5C64ED